MNKKNPPASVPCRDVDGSFVPASVLLRLLRLSMLSSYTINIKQLATLIKKLLINWSSKSMTGKHY